MSEAADLPVRVSRLEERMAEVHHLASRADREASDVHARLRAHTKSLEALRETQLEHGQRLDRLVGRIDQLDGRIDQLDGRIDQLDGMVTDGFTKLALGQAQITALLNIALKNSDET